MKQKGFTLIELLIVIAIIGLLAIAIIPNMVKFMATGQEGTANAEVASLNTAVAAYMADYDGQYPEDTGDLIPYIRHELVGEYTITDGEITGTGGWDKLEWVDDKWEQISE